MQYLVVGGGSEVVEDKVVEACGVEAVELVREEAEEE